ncbi:hypothetical protein [Paenibacillus sp. J2TS4]|uniref:hypothetical protein n=1 Tax=Paenibacillus sp. J2TS4 TaxID=2807194 RepID=UPI001BCC4AB2|nr:hypothetical protein [Paenibacillus sp. J2TS4]
MLPGSPRYQLIRRTAALPHKLQAGNEGGGAQAEWNRVEDTPLQLCAAEFFLLFGKNRREQSASPLVWPPSIQLDHKDR